MHLQAARQILASDSIIADAVAAEQRILSLASWHVPYASLAEQAQAPPTTVPPPPPRPAPIISSPYHVEEEDIQDEQRLQRKAIRVAERLRMTLLRLDTAEGVAVTAIRRVEAHLSTARTQQQHHGTGAPQSHHEGDATAAVALEGALATLDADMALVRAVAQAATMVIASSAPSRSAAEAALVPFEDSWFENGTAYVFVNRLVGSTWSEGSRAMRYNTKAQMDELFRGYVREACVQYARPKP